jgi:hypothetical protein
MTMAEADLLAAGAGGNKKRAATATSRRSGSTKPEPAYDSSQNDAAYYHIEKVMDVQFAGCPGPEWKECLKGRIAAYLDAID